MIIFGDGLNIDGDAFLEGVSSVNSDVAISGGLAGDNMAFKETFVMCNDGVLKHGIVAVMLEGEDLIANTDYKLNLMSIGNELKITHAQKNRVYTINNKKADEVYRHYLGEEVYKALPIGGFEFPLVCEKDGMQVARSVVSRHEDGSIEFAGNIDMDVSYNIGFASVNTLLQDMNQSLVPYENKAVESLFVYSCMVRRRFFKDYIDDETSLLTALGPVSGFFTYGEFYKNEKNCVMLNQTMTTLALSESAKAVLPKQECIPKTYDSTSTLVALHHLISVSNRELKEYKDKFNHLAYYDNLTSLANREKLKMKFDEELEQIKVTGNICAFIFLDLNRFKFVNDTHGHEVGDKLLKMVSKRLQKSVREKDVVSRVGGDEFIILLRQISQEDTFRILDDMSTRIVNVLELPFQIDGIHIEISTSLGIALYGVNGDNMDDLIKFADKDMYANKKSKSMSKAQNLVEEMKL